MKALITIVLVLAGLFIAPFATSASEEGTALPVAQPLVREGDFALALSEALIGYSANDEVEAENKLASIGIAPRNGWIADYPVTPEIIGDLRERVVAAADSRALGKNRDEALTALRNVGIDYDLPVYTAQDNSGYDQVMPASPDSAAVEGYYDENGPPVVSYYPPPDYYTYLYDWVPYPFWWSSVWFPGFFVLADFDFVVFNHHRHHRFHRFRDGRHFDGKHFARVTNHFVNRTTGKISTVRPATGTLTSGFSTHINTSGARALPGTAQSNAQQILGRSVARSPTANLSAGSTASLPRGSTAGLPMGSVANVPRGSTANLPIAMNQPGNPPRVSGQAAPGNLPRMGSSMSAPRISGSSAPAPARGNIGIAMGSVRSGGGQSQGFSGGHAGFAGFSGGHAGFGGGHGGGGRGR